jgi:chromosome segregation ATPase
MRAIAARILHAFGLTRISHVADVQSRLNASERRARDLKQQVQALRSGQEALSAKLARAVERSASLNARLDEAGKRIEMLKTRNAEARRAAAARTEARVAAVSRERQQRAAAASPQNVKLTHVGGDDVQTRLDIGFRAFDVAQRHLIMMEEKLYDIEQAISGLGARRS